MKKSVLRKCSGVFLTFFAASIFSSCASAQDFSGYDLSTVERVNAAREAKSGKQLDAESKGCVQLPKELPDIILLGSFAYDRGCALDGAIIKKRGLSMSTDFSRIALESLGWKMADTEKRKELALNWVRFGLLAFENPLLKATEDFKSQPFQTPQVSLNTDGSITVSLWVRRPSGMLCERGYDKFNYRFLKDGTLSEQKAEKSFTVAC